MQVRKVVTGHDAKGRAVIARDEQIDGVPIPGLRELASSGLPMNPQPTRTRGTIRRRPLHSHP
jgi:hypothetical protein